MMKLKNTGGETVTLIVSLVMTVLFAAAVAVSILLFTRLNQAQTDYAAFRSRSDMDLAEMEGKKTDAEGRASALSSELSALYTQYDALENERKALSDQLASLEENSDRQYADLKEQLAAREEEILELQENIAKLENVYSVDINAQFDILAKLTELLETGAPMKKVKVEKIDEEGNPFEVTEEVYPDISLYYEDIERGYQYAYNADEGRYAASMVKAPFALSVLEKASEEVLTLQAKIDELNAALPEDAVPYDLQNLPDGLKRTYDFDKIFTYTSDKTQIGTGKIKTQDEGQEYTYQELFEYMLRYSDNVAFNELKKEYGTTLYAQLANRLKTTALRKNLSNMSAADGGKVLKAIYEFIESDTVYSQFLYDCMTTSSQSVMITYAVHPRKVAHKYGWDIDSYHDMGIVYDEHPYVVVFMSDLDDSEVNDEANEYIRQVIKLVDQLHQNFYKKAK